MVPMLLGYARPPFNGVRPVREAGGVPGWRGAAP